MCYRHAIHRHHMSDYLVKLQQRHHICIHHDHSFFCMGCYLHDTEIEQEQDYTLCSMCHYRMFILEILVHN